MELLSRQVSCLEENCIMFFPNYTVVLPDEESTEVIAAFLAFKKYLNKISSQILCLPVIKLRVCSIEGGIILPFFDIDFERVSA